MTDRQDNIADNNDSSTKPTEDQPVENQPIDTVDEYMTKFEDVDTSNKNIAFCIDRIHTRPDDQQRLYAAIDCIKMMQKQQEATFDLLVEMNNLFGSK